MNNLKFATLREANIARIPQYKNSKGEQTHKGVNGSDWAPSEWLEAVVGELGEFANLQKKYRRGDITKEDFIIAGGKELADVITYLDILALQYDIDLGQVITDKFNEISARVEADVWITNRGAEDVTAKFLDPYFPAFLPLAYKDNTPIKMLHYVPGKGGLIAPVKAWHAFESFFATLSNQAQWGVSAEWSEALYLDLNKDAISEILDFPHSRREVIQDSSDNNINWKLFIDEDALKLYLLKVDIRGYAMQIYSVNYNVVPTEAKHPKRATSMNPLLGGPYAKSANSINAKDEPPTDKVKIEIPHLTEKPSVIWAYPINNKVPSNNPVQIALSRFMKYLGYDNPVYRTNGDYAYEINILYYDILKIKNGFDKYTCGDVSFIFSVANTAQAIFIKEVNGKEEVIRTWYVSYIVKSEDIAKHDIKIHKNPSAGTSVLGVPLHFQTIETASEQDQSDDFKMWLDKLHTEFKDIFGKDRVFYIDKQKFREAFNKGATPKEAINLHESFIHIAR